MNRRCLSVYLCLLQFFEESYSIQCSVISPNLFLLNKYKVYHCDVSVSGIVLFLSFSDNLLLVYRNTAYFCVVILYPATLLNPFARYSEFGNKQYTIWATVSSQSCFSWLYWASPSLATNNMISPISILTIWWCPCVESSLVLLEEGVCYDQCILLAKPC